MYHFDLLKPQKERGENLGNRMFPNSRKSEFNFINILLLTLFILGM